MILLYVAVYDEEDSELYEDDESPRDAPAAEYDGSGVSEMDTDIEE